MSTLLLVGFTAGIYMTTGSAPQNLLILDGLSAFFEFMFSYPYYYLALYLTLGTMGSYYAVKTAYAKSKETIDENKLEQEEQEEDMDLDTPSALPPSPHEDSEPEAYVPLFQVVNA